MELKAITANRLRDGAVVWLGPQGDWVERVELAAAFDDAAAKVALAEAEKSAAANVVVGVYAFEVEVVDGVPKPLRQRERIRAQGPSIRTDVGKQADALDRAA
ncbi:DUF2849 domain-containing protein [Azospirillum sp.]|uniref:DUF2849 domain-containing protein n=1 Tax=Azospirillum sp. TaxID=34012 RepID=UPI002D592F3A|nr:DUF2849 domain-containing protein [Azospirillum sp.]HYD67210.1 DUF2849 domain-containing protein [Azospirillum sp.]